MKKKVNFKEYFNKNKRTIIPIIIIIIAVVAGLIVFKNLNKIEKKDSHDAVVTVSKKLTENKKYKELTFSDIEVISTDELNHIALNITNNSANSFSQEFVKINFTKENGDIIDTVEAIIPDIDGNGNSRLDMVVDKKVLGAYTFNVVAAE